MPTTLTNRPIIGPPSRLPGSPDRMPDRPSFNTFTTPRRADCPRHDKGEVSIQEWGVLDYLWKEMQQSIREFVQFLERVYGDDDDDFLDVAWQVFDDDMSGAIDEEEWTSKVCSWSASLDLLRLHSHLSSASNYP